MIGNAAANKVNAGTSRARRSVLCIGFVPLTDCAPLAMARELGLFAKHGLRVRLSREIGWATVRDKVISGELHAAHALAAMPFAATFGFGSPACPCLTGLVLNLNGNGITLSRDLWQRGVRDARTLRAEIEATRGKRMHTFGVVFSHSTHQFLLRKWLARAGIDPDNDVRIVVVPAPSMVESLKAGNLDGFSVGEPWNSEAIAAGVGWCAATSMDLSPFHPEKVLMVTRRFAHEQKEEHLALIAALVEACAYCDELKNRPHVISVLSRPEYVGLAPEVIAASLCDRFDFGNGRALHIPDFHVFSRRDANAPSSDKAAWVLRHLLGGVAQNRLLFRGELAANVFRPDLFEQARRALACGAEPGGVEATLAPAEIPKSEPSFNEAAKNRNLEIQ